MASDKQLCCYRLNTAYDKIEVLRIEVLSVHEISRIKDTMLTAKDPRFTVYKHNNMWCTACHDLNMGMTTLGFRKSNDLLVFLLIVLPSDVSFYIAHPLSLDVEAFLEKNFGYIPSVHAIINMTKPLVLPESELRGVIVIPKPESELRGVISLPQDESY